MKMTCLIPARLRPDRARVLPAWARRREAQAPTQETFDTSGLTTNVAPPPVPPPPVCAKAGEARVAAPANPSRASVRPRLRVRGCVPSEEKLLGGTGLPLFLRPTG